MYLASYTHKCLLQVIVIGHVFLCMRMQMCGNCDNIVSLQPVTFCVLAERLLCNYKKQTN